MNLLSPVLIAFGVLIGYSVLQDFVRFGYMTQNGRYIGKQATIMILVLVMALIVGGVMLNHSSGTCSIKDIVS